MAEKQQTSTGNCQDEALIIDYLYDELDEPQRVAFEQRLKEDFDFAEIYAQQSQLELLYPRGVSSTISEEQVSGVRWALHKKLDEPLITKNWLKGYFEKLLTTKVSMKTQFASMLLTFLMGYVIANQYSSHTLIPSSDYSDNTTIKDSSIEKQAIPLEFIANNDYEITDMQVTRHARSSNDSQIDLVYSLASKTKLQGSLRDPKIQKLLADSIKNGISDSARLDLVDLLQEYSQTDSVKQALSYSLLNDPNPGVRMSAAESLAKLAYDKSVRDVLREALALDVNPGIRIEAFNALLDYQGEKLTKQIIQEYAINDSNEYIRNYSKKLLANEKTKQSTAKPSLL